ncbi:hypothetical protein [Janthinobacterium sp. LB3P112]|uniref:hypothetical protein n=1 Tax=Janthinobacterium sp. LB3P112 TaxID=3424196 RepID=UPI003F29216D
MCTHTCVEALAHPDLPQLAIGTPLPDTLMCLYRRQIMLEGNFTFQRGSEESAGKGWSVTPQFAGELRQAKVKE